MDGEKQAPTPQEKAEKPQKILYSAILRVKARLLPPEAEGEVGRLLALGRIFPIPGGGLSSWARKGNTLVKFVQKLRAKFPEEEALELLAILYPRTQEGRLDVEACQLHFLVPPGKEPPLPAGHFRVVGLPASWPGETLDVEIHPNPNGRLRKPFTLTLHLGPGLQGQVPIPGEEEALELRGRLDEEGCLVAEEARVVPRPPRREPSRKGKPGKGSPKAAG